MQRSANPLGRRYGSLREAAIYLGRTEKAVRKLVERHSVPFRRSGKRLVFDFGVLDQWMASLPGVGLEEALDRCLGQVPRTGARRPRGAGAGGPRA